jgi:hypothetical protein
MDTPFFPCQRFSSGLKNDDDPDVVDHAKAEFSPLDLGKPRPLTPQFVGYGLKRHLCQRSTLSEVGSQLFVGHHRASNHLETPSLVLARPRPF